MASATIINIGDELLIGQVINTNAAWLGEQLNLIGISIKKVLVIPDQESDILNALKNAEKSSEIIIITGGLGPTKDDITKECLCKFFDSELVFHQESYDNIIRLFSSRFRIMQDVNKRQADIPDACTPIHNANGTAPGMWFEKNGKIFISMPGVPFELKPMMEDYILDKLKERFSDQVIIHKTILTQGIGESALAEIISEWEDNLPENIKLAYLPQPGMVRLRLSCTGQERKKLQKQLDKEIDTLKNLIPELIFGYDKETLEAIIGNLMLKNKASLSTAESCTGGNIAHLITTVPGSSKYFLGSVVAYSNKVKMDLLGVKEETLIAHGAVSEECVIEMAIGIKTKLSTDYSIAVSGIAGPDGGTETKPVGTIWIAVSGPSQIIAKKFTFGNNRERNIRTASVSALNLLRKVLISE
ncbi:competence/damage-inducible protein A [Bacteroidota bacterium]